MNKTTLLLFLALMPGHAARTIQDAEQKDYRTALPTFRPLAERGKAEAQSEPGLMYAGGLGVPKNEVEAVNWLRKSAE